MSKRRIIEAAIARYTDYSHDQLADRLEREHGYDRDQMEYDTPQDDCGEPDYDRVRVVVYIK